ncbi:hypothetical protein K457DRAFT_32396 [Linnemannia elongata AG-77]|uniref:EI24-domain-containing protein n=1 Tax=Linnemannia elongata AG-77 TaxID=1314771 RepID=A0A197JXQ9_9FUNG|nr:hypothetical protein K457DRAFT_32396 [Linnemannia elongata AG-77]
MPQQGGALYPLLGIIYLFQHFRKLAPQFLKSLVYSFCVTLLVLLPLSAFTFKFQRRMIYAFLRFLFASLSFFFPSAQSMTFLGFNLPTWSAMILTMGETTLFVTLVMGEVFKREKSKGLFKSVMSYNNVLLGPLATVEHHEHKAKNSDDSDDTIQVSSTAGKPVVKKRRRDVVKDASLQFGQRIALWLVTLPLNFIPVVGSVVFCYINGKAIVPDIHRRYFDMKRMTEDERKEWIRQRQADYTAFAFVSQALELVPFLGVLFGFTNTIGAALWAVDLERPQDALRNRKLLDDAYGSQ